MRKRKWLVMALALIYWVSPLDLLPGIPLDDIVVMIAAILNTAIQTQNERQNQGITKQLPRPYTDALQ